ncbi:MAG: aminotransferase class I/II-fold pyridoxal phosphate-dependent enzyme [Saprospiraceae bacterium]
MKDSTGAIRIQPTKSKFREHSSPIFMTSSFQYSSAEEAAEYFSGNKQGDIYSRFSNPNTTELIEKMCFLEKLPAGVATSSGMATIFATLCSQLKSGDQVVASSSLFGNTLYILKNILPEWGIKCKLVEITNDSAWEEAISQKPKLVLVETPTNPGLDLIDLEWLSGLCRKYESILAVDNSFATPAVQKPALFGADLVIHSATKFIDGQGRVLGGIVLGNQELIDPIYNFLRRTGACLSPFNAWILSKSLETLDVRMERHCSNAFALAKFLKDHPRVKTVSYPFLENHQDHLLAKKQMKWGGGIVCCDLKGDKEEAFKFINGLSFLSITANLGDTRTIVTHPATTTHSKLSVNEKIKCNITDSTLRISVGLESIDDVIGDISTSFKKLDI